MTVVKKCVTDKYFEKKLDFQPKPMLYSALASLGPQLQSQLTYKSWLGDLGPDCLSSDTQNRAFVKKRKLHSNPRYGPDHLNRNIITTRSCHNPNLHQQKNKFTRAESFSA